MRNGTRQSDLSRLLGRTRRRIINVARFFRKIEELAVDAKDGRRGYTAEDARPNDLFRLEGMRLVCVVERTWEGSRIKRALP